jgi:transcription factor MBP1
VADFDDRPVYEMLCRTVAVMRRRSDAYLNATQILKVAGFDKPQRTRVLEREVQKGEHEKVQGGYGKYQGQSRFILDFTQLMVSKGTWIPIERGLALAKQYGVEDLLRPIIDYVPTSVSPPPAPKHIVAPPTKTKKDKEGGKVKQDAFGTPLKTGPTSAAALTAQAQLAAQRTASTKKQSAAASAAAAAARLDNTPPDARAKTPRSDDDGDSASVMSRGEGGDEESSSVTPSPIQSLIGDRQPGGSIDMDVDMGGGGSGMGSGMMMLEAESSSSSRKRPAATMMEEDGDPFAHLRAIRGQSAVHTPRSSPRALGMGMGEEPLNAEGYVDAIINYFISETPQIPQILIAPPPDFDPNARIDEDGHTALHWACAMGRVRVVKLLLTAGASIFASNNAEQTPLMRIVMFSNNYDVRKFPELYELLHRSTLNIDKHNRTVFHHIANLALTKGKTHAARYYMETILSRLSDYPQELADVINFQDEDGETALTLAARARSRRLVKALLDHGADPKVKNRDFKSAEDYILEDERFRSSPTKPRSGRRDSLIGEKSNGHAGTSIFAPQLYSSDAARMTGGSCLNDMTSNMQSLAKSFDGELNGKERDVLQAKAVLTSIHTEIKEAGDIIGGLEERGRGLTEAKRELEGLMVGSRDRMGEVLNEGWEEWLRGDEAREERWRGGKRDGEDYSDLEGICRGEVAGEWDRLSWEVSEKKRRRVELVDRYIKVQAEVGDAVTVYLAL